MKTAAKWIMFVFTMVFMITMTTIILIKTIPEFDTPTSVTILDHTSYTEECLNKKINGPTCVATHHLITFKENSTGRILKFHGWTQSKNGETKLSPNIKVGKKIATKKTSSLWTNHMPEICFHPPFENPKAKWCVTNNCTNFGLTMNKCGFYGTTFD